MKTMLNIKMDTKLKREAQKVAKDMGLPLSVVVNEGLKEFVSRREITFNAPLVPNARTARELKKSIADIKAGKNLFGPFKTAEAMIKSLNS